MRALSSRPFCSCGSQRVSLGDLSAGWRYTTRMNMSPSLPLGVYRLAPVPHPVPRGAIVVLPVPVSVRHVWSRWLPMLKPVAAVAGEAVCVRDGTLWIHGQDYGPVLRQTRGYALPHLPEGCTEI